MAYSTFLNHIKERNTVVATSDVNLTERIFNYLQESKIVIEEKQSVEKNEAILGRIDAVVMVLNEKSQNGTFYNDNWYKLAIEENVSFQSRLEKKLILGELDHPKEPGSAGKRAAFAAIKVWRNGNEVWAKLEIFNTVSGKELWTLIQAGVIIGFSLRGLGTDYYDGGVTKIEGKDFDLKGWDAVVDPSFIKAEFKCFSESKRNILIKNISENKSSEVCKMILEEINKAKNEEQKEKRLIFENSQLKSLVNKQTESIGLNEKNKLDEKAKHEVKLESLKNEISKITDILSQKNKILESKEKTIKSLKNNIFEFENKINLYNEEINEKKLLVDKYKTQLEDINLQSPEDKIQVFVKKIESSGSNNEDSIINRTAKGRQYTSKK